MTTEEYRPGLEGVIVNDTDISSITDTGLYYRGYPIRELVDRCHFEDVAYLLLYGDLPSPSERAEMCQELEIARTLPDAVAERVRSLPRETHPMDMLRSAVSLLAHYDPEISDSSAEANRRKATRLLARIPGILYYWRAVAPEVSVNPIRLAAGRSHAEYVLRCVSDQEPDELAVRVMDASLILYAEHELNASTFAARVTVSTLSDLHSGIVSAIGTLKGPLHGGANEAAMHMLQQISGPEDAKAWVHEHLQRGERIMGFGHRVVKHGDSRAAILHQLGSQLARRRGDTHWLETAEAVQEAVYEAKGLLPNVDFHCGWVYHMLGIPVPLFTPIFAASRTSGWSAHIIEQLGHNRLIRPRARYVGPAPRSVPAPSDWGTSSAERAA